MPDPPRTIKPRDILGVAEVLRVCGTSSRSNLKRWRAGIGVPAPFPKPMRTLKSGELWDRAEVRAWLAEYRPSD